MLEVSLNTLPRQPWQLSSKGMFQPSDTDTPLSRISGEILSLDLESCHEWNR